MRMAMSALGISLRGLILLLLVFDMFVVLQNIVYISKLMNYVLENVYLFFKVVFFNFF